MRYPTLSACVRGGADGLRNVVEQPARRSEKWLLQPIHTGVSMSGSRHLQSALVALCLAAGSAQAAELDQTTFDAIREVWQSQHKALDAHDADGVLATYADSKDIMLMGTGPGEHYIGPQEIKDAYAHFMMDFDPHTMQSKCSERYGSTEGNVAWLTAVCGFTDQKQDVQREYTVNLSAVAVKQGDAWRFHTMHFSHLGQNARDTSK